MKKAYLISTGTELLLGSTVDTNSMYLSEKLADLGIRVIGKSIVGDNEEHLTNAFLTGLESADIIIASGGLGPTKDDLTKEVACKVTDSKLEIVAAEVRKLEEYFASRNRKMAVCNIKQAMFPIQAAILENSLGTAPGMYLKKGEKTIILLPGPPREMKNMFAKEVERLLREEYYSETKKVASKTIKVFGPGESQVEDMLGKIPVDTGKCSIALLAIDGEVHIKMTAEGDDIEHSWQLIDCLSKMIRDKLKNNFIGYDNETLFSTTAKKLIETKKRIAAAESCTGGLLSKIITDLPGSSEYFCGSVISYSNEAKQMLLDIDEGMLQQYGAVSQEVARAMAEAVVRKFGADFGLATTGIAGPDGGTDEKPVGLVYIALADKYKSRVKEMRFVGDRNSIRMLASKTAMDLLRRNLLFGGGVG